MVNEGKPKLINWIKSHKISNKKIYLVFGMMRSGNHAIIHWLCDSISGGAAKKDIGKQVDIYGDVGFINDFNCRDNFFLKNKEFYKYMPKLKTLVISFEDVKLFNVDNINGNDVDNIIIIRSIQNVVASRLMGRIKNGNINFKCDSLFFDNWLNHADNCSKTSLCIKYDSWLISRDYRDKTMRSIGYSNLDSTNYVSTCGNGSSFIGVKLDNKKKLLSRNNQIKIPPNIQKMMNRNDVENINNFLFNSNSKTAVVFCVWKRLYRIKETLNDLKNQSFKDFDIFIWNNNSNISDELTKICAEFNLSIRIVNSDTNIGGIGRFVIAKKIHNLYDSIIFIDDDQSIGNNVVENMLSVYEPNTLTSWWSYRINSNYYDRIRVYELKQADYCGTGGMIVDSSLFKSLDLYKIPEKYQFIEDLWLSFVAKYEFGYKLRGYNFDIKINVDGNDQFEQLKYAKNDFYKFLCEKYLKDNNDCN